MKKLVKGIVEFRKKILPSYKEKFAELALGQSPDTLFIACSDSRVVPNLFASTDPGDLFVIRNVGNLIPCCQENGHSSADESEAAAIEFALLNLNVTDIIVCGHSECGAMQALVEGREKVKASNLKAWLRHGEPSLQRHGEPSLQRHGEPSLESDKTKLSPVNHLSQMNVLQQLEHLKSYPVVKDRVASGKLKLHGWWFELKGADVYSYEDSEKKFILIDEEQAQKILTRLS